MLRPISTISCMHLKPQLGAFHSAPPSPPEYTDVADAKVAWEESLLNLAQCQLRLGKHKECVQLCARLLASTRECCTVAS